MGLEPTSGMFPPPVFKTGSSSSRMTSVRFQLRELESNRAPSPWLGPSGFRAQRHYQQQLSRSSCVSRDTKVVLQVRKLWGQESNLRTRGSKPRISTSRNYPAVGEGRVGLEPTRWCLTNTCSAAELPTRSKVPCGNRTRLSRVEAWYLCRSAKGTCISKHLFEAEAAGLEPTTGFHPHLLSRQAPHPAG